MHIILNISTRNGTFDIKNLEPSHYQCKKNCDIVQRRGKQQDANVKFNIMGVCKIWYEKRPYADWILWCSLVIVIFIFYISLTQMRSMF